MTDWQSIVDRLRAHGGPFASGLSDAEVERAESTFSFRFPPDLRAFLQTALPFGRQFPDWRSGDEAGLRDWLGRPLDGVLFDVEFNGFWLPEWGDRPAALDDALAAARRLVEAAPKLIPVYQHRMMPAEPHAAGNPVFSVHQTDIIVYGDDLASYLSREFCTDDDDDDWSPGPGDARPIRFWDIERFHQVRWQHGGVCRFDNRRGDFPG